MKENNSVGLYIHIPFCSKICPFCSFSVTRNRSDIHERYIDQLILEIERDQDFPVSKQVVSVYLGGGTPSLLSNKLIHKLLEKVRSRFQISEKCMISFEMNPEDVSADKVRDLKEMGVNRISLGLQCFDDSALSFLGRNHSAATSYKAAEIMAKADLQSYNFDFMYGFPGYDSEFFTAQLKEFLKFHPHHLSLYCLTLEEGTPFFRKKGMREQIRDNESVQSDTFQRCEEILADAGCPMYELSNFCRPGHESAQNLIYWNYLDYVGYGCGAHSKVADRRFTKIGKFSAWSKAVDSCSSSIEEEETLTNQDRLLECLFINLRRREGLSPDQIAENWLLNLSGVHLLSSVREAIKKNLMLVEGNSLRLTPQGLFLNDEIAVNLYKELTSTNSPINPFK